VAVSTPPGSWPLIVTHEWTYIWAYLLGPVVGGVGLALLLRVMGRG
jgi:glycerol uptake facilitator-like aquaporin